MKLLSRLRLRKRRNQNRNTDSLLIERKTEMETHDSDRERKVEPVEEESSERKRETEEEEEEPSARNSGAEGPLTATGVSFRERKRTVDSPPTDDCCPICFGTFVSPCRAPCGHWYCGDCILQYWNHGAALQPCKCPMCSQQITRLTPEASLCHRLDLEVTDVLENVQKYNRLFVGGTYGLILKVLELPLFIKRMFREMMDPDRANAHLYKLRLFAILLGVLYTVSPFDFLPTGRLDAVDLFDYSAIALSFILYLVGLYIQRRRARQVRQLAVIQP